MPPWVRRIQQSWYFQISFPVLAVFATALLACGGSDFSHLTLPCFVSSLKLAAGYGLAYIVGVSQHSPGSATFNSDGTVNKTVERMTQGKI